MLLDSPKHLPTEIGQLIRRSGKIWARSPECPKVSKKTAKRWELLLNQWMNNQRLPLLIRKGSAVRGSELEHKSGRMIVPCDNSPAQWAYALAISNKVPTVRELLTSFAADQIPVSFAHIKAERKRRRYHCTLGQHSVNKKGWKLCHIKSVGIRNRQPLEKVDMDTLKEKFFDLMAPQNHFLLPLKWGGLGETEEFLTGFRQPE